MNTLKNNNNVLENLPYNNHADEYNKISSPILVVEDNLINQKVLKLYLNQLHFMQVEFASSGKEALQLTSFYRYSVILLDMGLPDMDGIDVCKILRQSTNTRFVPVIAVTAYNKSDYQQDILNQTLNDFISKPIDLHELNKKINKWARYVRKNRF